jgi:hypothetical protein
MVNEIHPSGDVALRAAAPRLRSVGAKPVWIVPLGFF